MEGVLMLQLSPPGDAADEMVVVGAGRVFQCKTCDRQFPTFQALGGHRTGHRRPKPRGDVGQHSHQAKAPKVHECTICGEEFAMGQALGGHMRRHRAVDASQRRRCAEEASRVCFDLNLPPTEQEEEDDVGFLTLGLGNGFAGKVPVLGYVDRSAITF